jgi:cytochrome P450
MAAANEFMLYIRALVIKRRAAPGEDLLTALIAAEDEGERMTEEELMATVVFMFTTDHATTCDLVGSGLLAFMNNRDQWERLVRDPSRPPAPNRLRLLWPQAQSRNAFDTRPRFR